MLHMNFLCSCQLEKIEESLNFSKALGSNRIVLNLDNCQFWKTFIHLHGDFIFLF